MLTSIAILKPQPLYNNCFAFAFLMLYSHPQQLRADNVYNLVIYEGVAPSKKNPAGKGMACITDLTVLCKERVEEEPSSIAIPGYLNPSKKDTEKILPIPLTLSIKVVSGSILEDDALQAFLAETNPTKEQLKEIAKLQGNLFPDTNVFDILKFHGHILARISKLYRYQQSNKILPDMEPFWEFVSSVIASMSFSFVNYPQVHTKFQAAIRESFEGTEFLKEYLDYLAEKLKQLAKNDPVAAGTLFNNASFCMAYLLSGFFQHSMDLFEPSYLAGKANTVSFVRLY
jgi:hypothetical protein